MPGLDVRLLGGFRLSSDGVPLEALTTRAREVLSRIVLSSNRLDRTRLAYQLWPSSSERQARTNLRQALHKLRSSDALIDAAFDLDGQRVGVRPEAALWVDATVFEHLLLAAERSDESGDHASAHRLLLQAAHLYGGDLLPECYADWIEADRARLRSAYRRMLVRLVAMLERRGQPEAAIEYAERIVQCEPFDEQAYQRLMRLHLRAGQRSQALAVFRSCVEMLEDELSAGPSAATLAVMEEAAACESGARGPLLERRPSDALPFVGRQSELQLLDTYWRQCCDRGPLLVHVHGDLGSGKSRLIQEFVKALAGRGVTVANGRAFAGEQGLECAALVTLLRSPGVRRALDRLEGVWRGELARLMPELEPDRAVAAPGNCDDDVGRRLRSFDAVARAFAHTGPAVLVIDDVQWADAQTLACLQRVLHGADGASLLVVIAAHASATGSNTPLTELLASLRRDAMLVELLVGPLPRAEATALAQHALRSPSATGVAGRLARQAHGHPLFVIEAALRANGATMSCPAEEAVRLRSIIADRLHHVTAEVRAVAAAAATLGSSFAFEPLAKLSGREPRALAAALDDLCRARVIDEVDVGVYAFVHDALFEAAEAMLSRTERSLVGRRSVGVDSRLGSQLELRCAPPPVGC